MDTPQSLVDDRGADGSKSYACLTCRQRKVKCDRHIPCNKCTRAGRQCSFVPPTRGKRKRTKLPREGLHAKLKRYEEQLRSLGAQIEPDDDDAASEAGTNATSVPSPRKQGDGENNYSPITERVMNNLSLHERHRTADGPVDVAYRPSAGNTAELGVEHPKLIAIKGQSRYFDSALWTQLGQQHPEIDAQEESSSDEIMEHESALFLDPTESKNVNVTTPWPAMDLLSRIKDVFMDRADPLIKVLHMPTFWAMVTEATQYPESASKATIAITFAFCFATVSMLEDPICFNLLGVEKADLLPRFRLAARHALVNANFLNTSDTRTLIAYLFFMVGVRSTGRCEALYAMSGVGIRLGQTMGLHRDGASLGLPPFETEMRRRLWWHLVQVDFRVAEMQGVNPSLDLTAGDAKYPLNLDDEDMHPAMTEFPPERKGIINITICRLRCEMVNALRRFTPSASAALRFEAICSPDLTLEQKDTIIDQIEDLLETKYLRYCDPTNSLHYLVSCMVRAPVCWMRFFAHNPRRFANNATEVSQRSRDIAFENARKMLGYASLLHSGTHGLGKYMWQNGTSFLWRSMLYVLIEVRHRKTGPEVDRCWQAIGEVLAQYPQIFEVSTTAVYKALGVWVLEVWEEYINAARVQGKEPPIRDYIMRLRHCCRLRSERKRSKEAARASASSTPGMNLYDDVESDLPSADFDFDSFNFDFPNLLSMEADPNGWSPWAQFLTSESGLA